MKKKASEWKHWFFQRPKYQRVVSYLVLAYATYLAILGLLVPFTLEKQIPPKLTELFGRQTSIGEIKINPFTLEISAQDFAIANSQGEAAVHLFAFKRLDTQLEFWRSIFTWVPTITDFVVTEPTINVAHLNTPDGNTYNFTDIVERLTSGSSDSDTTVEAEAANVPVEFRAQRIAIDNAKAAFIDHSQGVSLSYQDINLELSSLDLASTLKAGMEHYQHAINQIEISAISHDAQTLAVNGQFQVYPLEAQAEIALSAFDITDIWPYVDSLVPATLTRGTVSTKAHIELKQQQNELSYRLTKGNVSINDITVNDESQEKLAFTALNLSGIDLSSSDHKIMVDEIVLKQLTVDTTLDEKGIDLAALFTPVTSETAETQTANAQNGEESVPWLVTLHNLNVDASVTFHDQLIAKGQTWHISPIAITLNHIASDFSSPIDYQGSIALHNETALHDKKADHDGKLSLNGQVDITNSEASAAYDFSRFNLTALRPYIAPYINIHLQNGYLSTQGKVNSVWSSDATQIQGSLNIEQLAVNDPSKNEPLLSWDKMSLNDIDFSLAKQSLNIGSVDLNAPFAKMTILSDRSTNLADLTPKTTGSASSPTVSTAEEEVQQAENNQNTEPFSVTVGDINIHDGSAFFSDFSLTPNFSSSIRSIEGKISTLSTKADKPAKVDIKGKIDQYAPITLSGEVNPLLEEPYLDLILNVKNAELTSVSPYSSTYAGYYIDKGQISLTLQYYLEQGQLKGANHVYIDQLQLGKPSDSSLATSLPVKLAIALLQDRNGVIDLGVDVSGDVNDPSFGIGSIIWTAVKNIVTKAVTAPFSLLANLMGSDEELDKVAFDAGQASILPSEHERLQTLADALSKRPQLAVSLEGSVNPNVDANELAQLHLNDKLTELGVADSASVTASYVSSNEQAKMAVTALYAQTLGKSIEGERELIAAQLTTDDTPVEPQEVDTRLYASMYNQLLNAQTITPDDLHSLAVERAKSVKFYLVNELAVDPARIFLLSSRTVDSEKSEVLLTIDAK